MVTVYSMTVVYSCFTALSYSHWIYSTSDSHVMVWDAKYCSDVKCTVTLYLKTINFTLFANLDIFFCTLPQKSSSYFLLSFAVFLG